MLIDSHAHVFPAMGGPAGHRSVRDHMRYLQHMMASHHQPVRRADDGSIVRRPTLADSGDPTLDELSDVDFRGGGHGRFTWTVGGVDHYLQYLPPTLTRLSAPPELMVAQMDFVGIGRAVLQTGHVYGRLNRFLSRAVRRYPDRFWGLVLVDEWRVDSPRQRTALDHAIGGLGLHGLWFHTGNLAQHDRSETFDDPVFHPFWDHVSEMRMPVYLNLAGAPSGKEGYLAELANFGRWRRRYPEIPLMLPHGIPLFRFMENGEVRIPPEVWKVLADSNALVEILIPIFQGAIWEYPYVEAQPVVRQYYERLGPDRLGWGSDMPNVERNCTYKQSLDYLRLHCDFIPPADMAKICGNNVATLFAGQSAAQQPLTANHDDTLELGGVGSHRNGP
jgi:predicted TIM-barrel fold metal-dependent hydrolase